jgi:prevent-host-death family protein
VATGGYISAMEINLKQAKDRLSELVEKASAGETIIVTVHGKGKAKLVPMNGRTKLEKSKGINWAALAAYKKKHGIPTTNLPHFDLEEFNKPLPEDFLISPQPYPGEK